MSRFIALAAVALLSLALVLPASAGPILPRDDDASHADTTPTPVFTFAPATTPKAHPSHSRLEMDWLS
ncbi:hypothetical protein L226DRAFT_576537 [Lentinus tigrinus ALCF2SS1-7]|uniref:Uncharacterized protein n=1 Tax=Lentinus tigrinus ALCF2SS1-6 TaxID=1328759 RepID=A0A5C2RN64_9APHY|nr:hypothetical protein L227DRAFT_617280 [Lentinus tigrinus ALCF2SS1-6]RPD68297.1 hypothetical protein L226DRAFT_576537 [Lentinus tigrinus ALCF2SS1-7]